MSNHLNSSRSQNLRDRLIPLTKALTSAFKRVKAQTQNPSQLIQDNKTTTGTFEKMLPVTSRKQAVLQPESLHARGRIVVVKPVSHEQDGKQPYKSKFVEHL